MLPDEGFLRAQDDEDPPWGFRERIHRTPEGRSPEISWPNTFAGDWDMLAYYAAAGAKWSANTCL